MFYLETRIMLQLAYMYFGFVSDIVDAKWHLNMEKQNTEKG